MSSKTVYDFSASSHDGKVISLGEFRDKPLLIVNTASKCGFTPQYRGLQGLQDKFASQGFSVLAFPCNQFGGQEPGTDTEVAQFCSREFAISFPLFAKVDVNGAEAHPLFVFLKESLPGIMGSKSIKWNFTKFLIDRSGRPVRRFAPKDTPDSLRQDIEALL